MNAPRFEILDALDTELGLLCLRRRELLGRPGTIVTEVTIEHELLMSSLNTHSEEELSRLALEWHAGQGLRVLVGGLGLGYTARAALADPRVACVRVVDALEPVLGWFRAGLVPVAEEVGQDPRLELVQGDVYQLLLGPASERWDLLLIDVDHTPSDLLDPSSAPFYTAEGQARVAQHLAPGGVLAVWSAGVDADFAACLQASYPRAEERVVRWENELIDEGEWIEDAVFLAQRA